MEEEVLETFSNNSFVKSLKSSNSFSYVQTLEEHWKSYLHFQIKITAVHDYALYSWLNPEFIFIFKHTILNINA